MAKLIQYIDCKNIEIINESIFFFFQRKHCKKMSQSQFCCVQLFYNYYANEMTVCNFLGSFTSRKAILFIYLSFFVKISNKNRLDWVSFLKQNWLGFKIGVNLSFYRVCRVLLYKKSKQ